MNANNLRHLATTFAVLIAVVVSGCNEEIIQGLDERQANEVQSVLVEHGFTARKLCGSGKNATWSIEVPSSQSAEAISVLTKENLPRPKPQDFSDPAGLVPTPAEERNRASAKISSEVSQTLDSIDGVINSRVHVVLPTFSRTGNLISPAKASVFLRVREERSSKLNAMREDLKELVAGGVEHLDSSNVSLTITEVIHSKRPKVDPPEQDGEATILGVKASKVYSIGGALMSIGGGTIIFFFLRRLNQQRIERNQLRSRAEGKK